jgi:hypothetical protein
LDERSGPLGRFEGAIDHPLFTLPPEAPPSEHIECAKDRHEQIVEIMRHACGELTDGLEFLGLEEGLLSLA